MAHSFSLQLFQHSINIWHCHQSPFVSREGCIRCEKCKTGGLPSWAGWVCGASGLHGCRTIGSCHIHSESSHSFCLARKKVEILRLPRRVLRELNTQYCCKTLKRSICLGTRAKVKGGSSQSVDFELLWRVR